VLEVSRLLHKVLDGVAERLDAAFGLSLKSGEVVA
jgi:hypothetical protein